WALGEEQGWEALTDRVLVLDAGERLDDPARLLWLALAHIDPERDVHRSSNPVHDAGLRQLPNWHPRRLGLDATAKGAADGFERDWPTEQVHPPELIERLSAGWSSEWGLPGSCPR